MERSPVEDLGNYRLFARRSSVLAAGLIDQESRKELPKPEHRRRHSAVDAPGRSPSRRHAASGTDNQSPSRGHHHLDRGRRARKHDKESNHDKEAVLPETQYSELERLRQLRLRRAAEASTNPTTMDEPDATREQRVRRAAETLAIINQSSEPVERMQKHSSNSESEGGQQRPRTCLARCRRNSDGIWRWQRHSKQEATRRRGQKATSSSSSPRATSVRHQGPPDVLAESAATQPDERQLAVGTRSFNPPAREAAGIRDLRLPSRPRPKVLDSETEHSTQMPTDTSAGNSVEDGWGAGTDSPSLDPVPEPTDLKECKEDSSSRSGSFLAAVAGRCIANGLMQISPLYAGLEKVQSTTGEKVQSTTGRVPGPPIVPSTLVEAVNDQGEMVLATVLMVDHAKSRYKIRTTDGHTVTVKADMVQPASPHRTNRRKSVPT
mmetsp:Transcript_8417/g.22869  ORF Transcript_8417/g.22869 Transcript_8417/m.22869 type:complete len:436 (-) Transcript_8417:155-1462(-)|eukprot:CAMPEP_0171216396 /NCGR_PEP_ID=MMETSP0790-20130122/32160_1 /TAXON_ID=2925 /ORGANISM="Alexandrium catenella, Strain OF101" /LENGTH=435 /DNA_ID=CAMNT_0011682177 /DNA_START=72 /DNA_END=1379 /DNA_ORIENTATION=+